MERLPPHRVHACRPSSEAALILLIDDHTLFRAGLRMVIRESFKDIELLDANSLEEALQHVGDAPQIVLLDIQLPGLNGIDAIPLLKRRWPAVPIVILSSSTDTPTINAAFAKGAISYIAKSDTPADIIGVIEHLLRGEAPKHLRCIDSLSDRPKTDPRLTPRQCEVLALLCEGHSNKLIGRRLGLSENTIRGHVQAILAFLHVSSRTEAVVAARRKGLVL